MKKLIILFLSISFLFSITLNAEEKKALSEMTEEELVQEFMRLENEKIEAKAKTHSMKRETESIKQVGKKLDEIIDVISKDK